MDLFILSSNQDFDIQNAVQLISCLIFTEEVSEGSEGVFRRALSCSSALWAGIVLARVSRIGVQR